MINTKNHGLLKPEISLNTDKLCGDKKQYIKKSCQDHCNRQTNSDTDKFSLSESKNICNQRLSGKRQRKRGHSKQIHDEHCSSLKKFGTHSDKNKTNIRHSGPDDHDNNGQDKDIETLNGLAINRKFHDKHKETIGVKYFHQNDPTSSQLSPVSDDQVHHDVSTSEPVSIFNTSNTLYSQYDTTQVPTPASSINEEIYMQTQLSQFAGDSRIHSPLSTAMMSAASPSTSANILLSSESPNSTSICFQNIGSMKSNNNTHPKMPQPISGSPVYHGSSNSTLSSSVIYENSTSPEPNFSKDYFILQNLTTPVSHCSSPVFSSSSSSSTINPNGFNKPISNDFTEKKLKISKSTMMIEPNELMEYPYLDDIDDLLVGTNNNNNESISIPSYNNLQSGVNPEKIMDKSNLHCNGLLNSKIPNINDSLPTNVLPDDIFSTETESQETFTQNNEFNDQKALSFNPFSLAEKSEDRFLNATLPGSKSRFTKDYTEIDGRDPVLLEPLKNLHSSSPLLEYSFSTSWAYPVVPKSPIIHRQPVTSPTFSPPDFPVTCGKVPYRVSKAPLRNKRRVTPSQVNFSEPIRKCEWEGCCHVCQSSQDLLNHVRNVHVEAMMRMQNTGN